MAEDIRKMENTKGIMAFEKRYHKPYCIILDSEYCSMGRMIAITACKLHGYAYHDTVSLLKLAKDRLSLEELWMFEDQLREKRLTQEQVVKMPEFHKVKAVFDQAITLALAQGPCLIHEWASKQFVASLRHSCLRVMVYAEDMNDKLVRARLSPLYKQVLDDELLKIKIKEEDNIRANYHQACTNSEWGMKENYDLCLNSDALGQEMAVKILSSCMKW